MLRLNGLENRASTIFVSEIVLNGYTVKPDNLNKIGINERIDVQSCFLKEIHSNFKLDKNKDNIYLWDSEGNIVDSVNIIVIPANNSYARYPDGGDKFYFCTDMSPGQANTNGYTQLSAPVEIEPPGGWYDNEINVALSNKAGDDIYYTLDGSEPDS